MSMEKRTFNLQNMQKINRTIEFLFEKGIRYCVHFEKDEQNDGNFKAIVSWYPQVFDDRR